MLTATQHKGVQSGISSEGVQVVRIHYSADPLKDPTTSEGAEWFSRELQGYRGKTDPRWRKEMEIDFDAHGGQLLFPYLFENEANIYVNPYEVRGMTMCSGLDYGTRNPSAFEVLSVDYDGNIQAIWEYYEEPKRTDESDEQFKKRKGYKALSAAIKKCPYFSRKLIIYADPSLWNKTQESADPKGLRSMADLFVQEGIYLSPGQKGRDFACYEKLNNKGWKNPAQPQLTIMRNCKWLWWELQRLRFADFSATVMVNKNLQEKIVDKDNHAWDAVKYALMTIPQFTQEPKELTSLSDRRLDMLEKGVQTPTDEYEKHLLRHVDDQENWAQGLDYENMAPGETIGTIEDY